MTDRQKWIAAWGGLAVLLLIIGGLSLAACGLRLPGNWLLFAYCDANAAVDAFRDENLRTQALKDERDRLRRQLALSEPCETCAIPETSEVMLLLDASMSMLWDYNADPALLEKLDEADRADDDQEYDRIFELLMRGPNTDRLDVAKSALSNLINSTPRDVSFEFLHFAECGRPAQFEGRFESSRRGDLQSRLQAVNARNFTALAEALTGLPGQTKRGRTPNDPVNIVLVSDGEDNCEGDPCAAARALKQEMPFATVSVIAMTPNLKANSCVADATGGLFLTAENIDEISNLIQQAAGQAGEEDCLPPMARR